MKSQNAGLAGYLDSTMQAGLFWNIVFAFMFSLSFLVWFWKLLCLKYAHNKNYRPK